MECVLHIKNMVCDRCVMVVRALLVQLGMKPLAVGLGTVRLAEEPDELKMRRLEEELGALGFGLIADPRTRIVEGMKTEIVRLVHRSDDPLRVNLSDHLAGLFHHEYGYLSRLFSEATGTTVEKYFIAQKTERVKELLAYGELSLAQIADRLGYSSSAHLSAQFKSVTGMTPGQFRRNAASRTPLDKV